MRKALLAVTLGGAVSTAAWASDHEAGPGSMRGLQIGGMAVVSPTYEGSSRYRVMGVPMVAPAGGGFLGSGLVQFKGVDDLRFRLLDTRGFEAGPLIGWRFGREEDDGKRLHGLGDVDGGLVAGAYAAMKLGSFKPFLSYHHQLTGDDTGGVLRFGTEAELKLDRAIKVTATLGATYASGDYMHHYFSVTAAQAATSVAGLRVYDANAGIKDIYFGLSGSVPLGDRWTLRAGARYTRLVGDAADSPIVETADQFSGSLGLSYRLDWGR